MIRDRNWDLRTIPFDELLKKGETSGKGDGAEMGKTDLLGKIMHMEINRKELDLKKFHIAPSYTLGLFQVILC